MASVPQGDDLIQRAYAQAILPLIVSGTLAPGQQVSFCPVTQQGLIAGQFVPPEVTNEQVYPMADCLLPMQSPVYIPDGGSYFQALQTYLAWVDPGGDPSAGAKQRLINATNAMNDASNNFLAARTTAIAAWKNDPDYPAMSFNEWVVQFDNAYGAAQSAANTTLGDYDAALAAYGGPLAGLLGTAVKNVTAALAGVPAVPGLNMDVIAASWPDMQAYLTQIQNNKTPGLTDTAIYTLPAYTIQGDYPGTCQNWVNTYKVGAAPAFNFSIDLSAAQSFSWSQAGYSTVNSKGYSNFWFFVTAEYESQSTTQTAQMDTSSAASEVELTLTAWGLEKFSLASGTWDIKNLQTTFPTLLPGAPTNLIPTMIQPKAFLAGYGVGLSGKFSGSTLSAFNSLYSKVTSSSQGKMNIFGFDIFGIGANGNSSSTSQVTTASNFSYNSTTGEFNIPAQDNAYPILLAVLGESIAASSPSARKPAARRQ